MPFLLRAVQRRGSNHKLNVPKSHVECKTTGNATVKAGGARHSVRAFVRCNWSARTE
jgi:hypothetical protein